MYQEQINTNNIHQLIKLLKWESLEANIKIIY